MSKIYHIETISEIHQQLGLPKPKHPLVSVIDKFPESQNMSLPGVRFSTSLYSISLKLGLEGTIYYGRNTYDYQEGTLIFVKPNQVVEYEAGNEEASHDRTWSLIFHPDLIRKSELGGQIDKYSFFDYDAREALHLSDDEKSSIQDIVKLIQKEISLNLDRHSQELINSNIKLLLDYCTRYFDRQFYTRTNLNKDIVADFEKALKAYYNSGKALEIGVPTVSFLGKEMGMSPYYLSDLLKKETGRNTIEHIHFYIIDKAKSKLLSSNQSVSEIAYALGFEYPQHFAKVFKNKTGISPSEYRKVN
ncbi:MAG: helix-turn-helix transcriptional regulator [Bacteroidota bacterium]